MDAVSADSELKELKDNEKFNWNDISTILLGHFTHDMFTAWLTPLLPLIRQRLGTSFTGAGGLVIFLQIPTLLTPFIGYLADRVSLRYFIILAPAVTGTLMSLMGLAPSYTMLALLMFAVGFSVAAFHAPSPAMIGRMAGDRVGLGMSLYMAAGEMGRALGPLLVLSAIGWFGLEGIWRMSFIGWGVSLFLWWRLRNISAKPSTVFEPKFAEMWPQMMQVFPALMCLMLLRMLLVVSLTVFLPLYLTTEANADFWVAGQSLVILEAAGVVGALMSGTLSDWFGRNRILFVLLLIGPLLMLLFINVSGSLLVPVLILLGFVTIATTPVFLAMVQDNFPDNRAFANGIFMMLNFVLRALAIWIIGLMADAFGLQTSFYIAAMIAFLSIPAIWFLPKDKHRLA